MPAVVDSPFEMVQSNFVMFSPDDVDPSKIPPHLRAYYDHAFAMYQRFRHYAGCRDIPANDWPLICLLAEQQRRIEILEDALGGSATSSSSSLGSAGQAAAATPPAAAPRRGPGRPRKQEMTTDG